MSQERFQDQRTHRRKPPLLDLMIIQSKKIEKVLASYTKERSRNEFVISQTRKNPLGRIPR